MMRIPNIFFDGKDRWLRRWPTACWLGAALVLAAVGGSISETAAGTSEPTLQAAAASADAPTPPSATSATAVAVDGGGEHDAALVGETSARSGGEQQRRIFMLLLLNSAGPMRPYGGLSR